MILLTSTADKQHVLLHLYLRPDKQTWGSDIMTVERAMLQISQRGMSITSNRLWTHCLAL